MLFATAGRVWFSDLGCVLVWTPGTVRLSGLAREAEELVKSDDCKLADHEEGRAASSLCPRSLALLTDITFFFSMDLCGNQAVRRVRPTILH